MWLSCHIVLNQGVKKQTETITYENNTKVACKFYLRPHVWRSLLHTELPQFNLFQGQQMSFQGAIHGAAGVCLAAASF